PRSEQLLVLHSSLLERPVAPVIVERRRRGQDRGPSTIVRKMQGRVAGDDTRRRCIVRDRNTTVDGDLRGAAACDPRRGAAGARSRAVLVIAGAFGAPGHRVTAESTVSEDNNA